MWPEWSPENTGEIPMAEPRYASATIRTYRNGIELTLPNSTQAVTCPPQVANNEHLCPLKRMIYHLWTSISPIVRQTAPFSLTESSWPRKRLRQGVIAAECKKHECK